MARRQKLMDITNLIKEIRECKLEGRTVYVCGNGGSASNAEHFTNDLFKKGIKAVCLNSNVSLMTMIANDYGYRNIFSFQLEVFANKLDLFISISCSGTSPNIEDAYQKALEKGMIIRSFPTFGDEKKHSFEEYGKLENEHLKIIHKVAARV